jgi:hypothetical protein
MHCPPTPHLLVVDAHPVGWMHIVHSDGEAIVRISADRDDPGGGDGVVPTPDMGFVSIRDLPSRSPGAMSGDLGTGWTVASGRVDAALAPDHDALIALVNAITDHVLGDEIQVNLRVDVTRVTAACCFDGESRDEWRVLAPG